MKKIYYILLTACLGSLLLSCNKDLNLTPTNDITADVAYATPEGYRSGIAKVYGAYALTGSTGAGSSDLGGIDAGTSDFLRLYWNAQELTTDEAICAWLSDPGVADLNYNTWTSQNVMLQGLYTRSLYQITVANEFLKESTDQKLSERGISTSDIPEIHYFAAEARFLRAFQYWVLLDLFGNPPFVTELSTIGKEAPPQIKRADLFNYVESELLSIEGLLKGPKQNAYGRADQAAAWALLARLYLNAEVYIGVPKYTEAISYAKKVIEAGYTLHNNYSHLFLADNDLNNPEVILSINYDGVKSQNNGGTTFIINAAVNADMGPANFGIPNGGWGGNRSRKSLPETFGDYSGNTDKRAMFYGDMLEIDDASQFTQGLAVTKFKNITSLGQTAPSVGGSYCSTDFPLFRLAEIYLIYAEAVSRGGTGGSEAEALTYINRLRERAFGNASGNHKAITLELVFNERSRELYWEAFRRTDLIRFGRFTAGSYLWPFKGGVKNGKGFEMHRTLFGLPATDVTANPNLIQNEGY